MAGYRALHMRVEHARGRASEHTCPCGNQAAEWSLTHGADGTDPDHYQARCTPCHREYDVLSYTGKTGPKNGMECWNRALDEDAVEDIRVRHGWWGESCTDLAREYRVARNTVSAVVHFRNWKHVRTCEI